MAKAKTKKSGCGSDIGALAERAAKAAMNRAITSEVEPLVRDYICRMVRQKAQAYLKEHRAEIESETERLVAQQVKGQLKPAAKKAAAKVRLTAEPRRRW